MYYLYKHRPETRYGEILHIKWLELAKKQPDRDNPTFYFKSNLFFIHNINPLILKVFFYYASKMSEVFSFFATILALDKHFIEWKKSNKINTITFCLLSTSKSEFTLMPVERLVAELCELLFKSHSESTALVQAERTNVTFKLVVSLRHHNDEFLGCFLATS